MRLILIITLLSNKSFYTMKDLEILYKEKNFDEFFNHAKDILPSERSSYWKDMVKEMAEAQLKDYIKKKYFDNLHYKKIKDLTKWPTLKTDEFFMKARGNWGVGYFKSCFKFYPPEVRKYGTFGKTL